MVAAVRFSDNIRDMHIEAIYDSLRFMPDCAYRRYSEWLLETPKHTDEWLQLVGVQGLMRLTGALLGGLLNEAEMDEILPYSVPMNISQMYEVVSDNLALGLAEQCASDPTYLTRRQALRGFNQAVIARLEWNPQMGKQALLPMRPLIRTISVTEQNLSPHKHYALINAFLGANPDVDPDELDYAMFPLLVANLDTCSQLVDAISGMRSEGLVRSGLVRRYAGVNTLLDKKLISREEMVTVGIDTIMVIPTLAYYVGIIAEKIHPLSEYKAIIFDGSLLEALEDAALLVRLLNDMGSTILEQSHAEREAMIASLVDDYDPYTYLNFSDWLGAVTVKHGAMFTRLRKDCVYGEFNVCLHQARTAPSLADACEVFAEDMLTLSQIYDEGKARLTERLSEINARLGDPIIGNLIARFVEFHKVVYSQPFNDPHGEYAV